MSPRPEASSTSSATAPLAIEAVEVAFGGNMVLKDLSLRVAPGFTGLIGPNGAGKTTCLNVISGYVRPQAGRVLLEGRPLTGLRPHAVAGRGVGRTFQTPRLLPGLTVLDNVLLGAHLGYGHGHVAEILGLPHARRRARQLREKALATLDGFGLADQAGLAAGALSLGSQKVVEVARALMNDVRLLLLDEPAAGLGAQDVDVLVAGLSSLLDLRRSAVVIVEHDLELITRLCPTAAVLHFGHIIAEGPPAELLRNPTVVDAYLGAGFVAS